VEGYRSETYGSAFADVYDEWYRHLADPEACAARVAALAGGGLRVRPLRHQRRCGGRHGQSEAGLLEKGTSRCHAKYLLIKDHAFVNGAAFKVKSNREGVAPDQESG